MWLIGLFLKSLYMPHGAVFMIYFSRSTPFHSLISSTKCLRLISVPHHVSFPRISRNRMIILELSKGKCNYSAEKYFVSSHIVFQIIWMLTAYICQSILDALAWMCGTIKLWNGFSCRCTLIDETCLFILTYAWALYASRWDNGIVLYIIHKLLLCYPFRLRRFMLARSIWYEG